MAADAIHFDQINLPAGVEPGDGIVIGLAGGIVADSVIVEIPRADIRFVGGIGGAVRRAVNRKIVVDCLFGNSAKNVDAEFQAERMDVIGEGLESGSVVGGWETAGSGKVAAVAIHYVLKCFGVPFRHRIGNEPVGVDDDVLPGERLEVYGKP